jgi:glycosyltransferase involved in cell wall biosynthesis
MKGESTLMGNNAATVVPAKVCMHVLGAAHDDVRAKRAAKTLVNAGYEVSIIDIESGSTSSSGDDMHGVSLRHLKVSNSFVATRFRRWAFFKAAWIFIRGVLWLIQTPADIYHALDLPALPACYIASRLRRKPLIFESYELPFSTLALSDMTTGRYLLQKFSVPFINHIVPRCAGVIAVSAPIIGEMKKRYTIPQVSLVRNIPPYQPVVRSDRLRRLLGLEPSKRIALYQGYLQTGRGLDTLIRAAAFLEKDIVIVIMGKDKLGTQARLEALIKNEGVTDQVKIIPSVPYNDLLGWTASADLGLIVSPPDYSLNTQMLLPNKLFEFLMAGLPVLSSRLEAIVDVIGTYDVGQVVTSLTPADIAAAINRMLADKDALDRMRRNAINIAQQELNWEKEQQNLIQLYLSIFLSRFKYRRNTMQLPWKKMLKHAIPQTVLNTILLSFPFLYHTRLVFYETNLQAGGGIDELLDQMSTVLDVKGNIVECGCSRCGASIIMAKYLQAQQVEKQILACDSYEGFDRLELENERKDGLTTVPSNAFTSTSYGYVQKKIAALGFQHRVLPIKGYFQDSLPKINGPFCMVLIDCDLRESLMYSAETLWPKLSSGGRMLFDDYLDPRFKGAKQGVDLFLEKHRHEITAHGLLNRLYYICKG